MDATLREIRLRLEKATPGRWRADGNINRESKEVVWGSDGIAVATIHGYRLPNENADLIAHAPADVAYLLARLEKAEAVCEAARKVIIDFSTLKQKQFEKLILHQTLESASENWNTPDKTVVDFQPLTDALTAWQEAQG